MKPILYSPTETAFDTNGIGILSDAISAQVVQELNGQYELTMKYPVTGIHAESIADRCIIMAKPDPVTDPQPFRIYRINPVSKGTITVYARHLAYDTMGIPVAPFSAESATDALITMKDSAAVDCPFSFSTDKSVAATMAPTIPKSMWKTLGGSEGSILDVYGGEYEFDRYNIRLHTRRGANNGVSIRYGKNLKTLEQDRNCANVYTGIYPYWSSFDGVLVQLPEKVINATGTYSFVRIATVDFSAHFEEPPTEAQLRARAERYMTDNQIGIPAISLKVEFVPLEQTAQYKDKAPLERVLLGDSVTVIFPDLNVNACDRVTATVFDSLQERYSSVTLGKIKSNFADTVVTQKQEIETKPSMATVQYVASKVKDNAGNIADLTVKADEISGRVENAEHEMTEIKQTAGQVSVEATDENGTLVTRINANEWIAEHTDNNGTVTSGFYYDFALGRFVYDGAGVFRSRDGNSYITIEGHEFVLYAREGEGGAFKDIARIGFTEDHEGYDYPYFLMGNADAGADRRGLTKMFKNGIYQGNAVPLDTIGAFMGMSGSVGFFVDTLRGIAYTVEDETLTDVSEARFA